MRTPTARCVAVFTAIALVVAACGGSDTEETTTNDEATATSDATATSMEDTTTSSFVDHHV